MIYFCSLCILNTSHKQLMILHKSKNKSLQLLVFLKTVTWDPLDSNILLLVKTYLEA